MNETDLRHALREHAQSFRPDPEWLRRVPVPRRGRRRIAMTSPVLLAAAAAAVVVVSLLAPSGDSRSPTAGDDTVTTAVPPDQPVRIHLVGYSAPVGGAMPKPLQRHLTCMRAHGYDLPDPAWTGRGWMLTVTDVQGLGVGTPRWKRTVFGTCALTRPDRRLGHPDDPGIPSMRHLLMHPRPRHGQLSHE